MCSSVRPLRSPRVHSPGWQELCVKAWPNCDQTVPQTASATRPSAVYPEIGSVARNRRDVQPLREERSTTEPRTACLRFSPQSRQVAQATVRCGQRFQLFDHEMSQSTITLRARATTVRVYQPTRRLKNSSPAPPIPARCGSAIACARFLRRIARMFCRDHHDLGTVSPDEPGCLVENVQDRGRLGRRQQCPGSLATTPPAGSTSGSKQ